VSAFTESVQTQIGKSYLYNELLEVFSDLESGSGGFFLGRELAVVLERHQEVAEQQRQRLA
jgi:hypothetical protein